FAVVLGGWVTLTSMKSKTIGEADRRFRATQAAQSMLALAREGLLAPGQHYEVPDKVGLKADLTVEDHGGGVKVMHAIVTWREPGQREVESVKLSTLCK
ncbi:MAG TPA: hypothetical protein VHF22_03870, partial [Planctomycetota bacterium]|nr:hypothetical protein [Planctomycetota bacterium]